jgi:hypothetical protein
MPAPYRKACTNCAKSKRRCDLGLSRCYRCRVRSLDCQYDNSQSAGLTAQVESTPDSSNESEMRLIGSNNGHKDDFNQLNPTMDITPVFDQNQIEASLPPFPDYDLDWPDVMTNIDSFLVPDQIEDFDAPSRSVLAGEIYQERIIYSVKRMKAYTDLFVRQGSTPFINGNLYAESMPTTLLEVLSVCALYGQKTERNQSLVFRTISHKASRLVEDYVPVGLSAMEQLASVQALILYQIIRLFDGDIRQRADAERAVTTLNVWTKQLKLRMQRLSGTSQTDQFPALSLTADSWRSWLFAESVRRTLIISFSVQGFYCFLKNGWDDSHHDFEDLSFYAQRALWVAPSEHYWQEALKEHSMLPLRFSNWDEDIADAEPADIEDLGMLMMVLMKGVDYCQGWVGGRELERFGLALQENPN